MTKNKNIYKKGKSVYTKKNPTFTQQQKLKIRRGASVASSLTGLFGGLGLGFVIASATIPFIAIPAAVALAGGIIGGAIGQRFLNKGQKLKDEKERLEDEISRLKEEKESANKKRTELLRKGQPTEALEKLGEIQRINLNIKKEQKRLSSVKKEFIKTKEEIKKLVKRKR